MTRHDPSRPRCAHREHGGTGAERERDHRCGGGVDVEHDRPGDDDRRERVVQHPVNFRGTMPRAMSLLSTAIRRTSLW